MSKLLDKDHAVADQKRAEESNALANEDEGKLWELAAQAENDVRKAAALIVESDKSVRNSEQALKRSIEVVLDAERHSEAKWAGAVTTDDFLRARRFLVRARLMRTKLTEDQVAHAILVDHARGVSSYALEARKYANAAMERAIAKSILEKMDPAFTDEALRQRDKSVYDIANGR